MSVLDDFNRIGYERANGKYKRAQFDDMTKDDWVALVEGERARVEELEDKVEELEAVAPCQCGCGG